ncbi:MAG: hypothetical protein HWN66_16670 [Candidatus Helarchaeota archaeon]|nr:hypothetical protein [Candidatus Helarchaeota archaeon]
MVLLRIILNEVSPQLRNDILAFIRSLKQDLPTPPNEWDEFAVKLLYTLFEIED